MMTQISLRLRKRVVSVALALGLALSPNAVAQPSEVIAAVGSQSQSIYGFLPPYTAVIGDTLTLSAAATSGLSVSLSTNTPEVCSISEAQVTMLRVGTCSIAANQGGDATWAAVTTEIRSIEVAAVGYHAVATATAPDGTIRTDGSIFVGDTLDVRLNLPSGTISRCYLRISTRGGWLMQFWGTTLQDDSCGAQLIIPEPAQPDSRLWYNRDDNDVCITPLFVFTSAGNNIPMQSADRVRPGNYRCYNGADRSGRFDEVLDFSFDGTGDSSVPFDSTPKILSWNMKDWDPTYRPLAFNVDWHVAMPDWIENCNTYLNGSWLTVLTPAPQVGCPDWHMHLPGVLPAAMPWGGGPGSWGVEIVMTYSYNHGESGGNTISYQDVPYETSDRIFSSSLPMVFPTDLASTRFVTLGEAWTPSFHVTAGGAGQVPSGTVCRLYVGTGGWSYEGWPQEVLDVGGEVGRTVPDENDNCQFNVTTPYTSTQQGNQYYVSVAFPGANGAQYASTIHPVVPLTPPTILEPTPNQDGSTDIVAEPGDGQGMSLEVDLAPEVAPETQAQQHSFSFERGAVAKVADCSTVAYTTDFKLGGAVPDASARCNLAPGRYLITARMVDVAGKVQTTTRTVVIAASPKRSLTGLFTARANASAAGATVTYTAAGTTVALSTVGQAGGGAITYSESDADCSISGRKLTVVQVGDGSCVVTASIAESATYLSATDTVTITINKAAATLSFTQPPNVALGVAPFKLVATTSNTDSSTITLTVAEGSSAVCSVSGSTVTVTDGGRCSITASRDATANYLAAPTVVRSFTVTRPLERSAATIKPTISGTATVDLTLTADKGTWTGYPAPTFAYQWYACTKEFITTQSTVPPQCSKISGATQPTVALVSAQRGQYIAVFVTGTSAGTPATSWLTITTPRVLARATATVKPTISGTTTVGKTLTAARGTWSGYPTPTYTYTWYACTSTVSAPTSTVPDGICTAISGATSSTFKLTATERDSYIAVLVTGTSAGTATTAWLSKSTAIVK